MGSLPITLRQSRHGVAHKVHSHVRERLLRTLVPWPVVHTVIDTWWLSEAPASGENGVKSRYARNRSKPLFFLTRKHFELPSTSVVAMLSD